ncbi:hepcidin [Dromaius novaehollandiae]|uniref:hepcidin n=1 Tax=Dromaius novaehollandiae TaxID=8790 RepID=UPI00311F1201
MKLAAATGLILLLLLLLGRAAPGRMALLPSEPSLQPHSEVGDQQALLPLEPSLQPQPWSEAGEQQGRRRRRRRRRHGSHFPLCSYCCNCCRNRGCGLCCRT